MRSIYLFLILFFSTVLLSKCGSDIVSNSTFPSPTIVVSPTPTEIPISDEDVSDDQLLKLLESDDIDIDAEFRSLELELSE